MYVKEFSEHKVIISDGTNDYELRTTNDSQSFDLDILESILNCPIKEIDNE